MMSIAGRSTVRCISSYKYATQIRSFSLNSNLKDNCCEKISVKWKLRDHSIITTHPTIGSSILNEAHKNDIELEGACEGVCACSTCHVILEDAVYDALPEPVEIEEDMLDQAFGLTATSRLGCQVKFTKDHDGMTITIPAATRNFYVDGHVPKPH